MIAPRAIPFLGVGGLLAAASAVALVAGAIETPPADVLAALASACRDRGGLAAHVVCELRVPRLVLAMAAGCALAVSGAALQAVFRNGLADPGLIGVTGGATLGAVGAIMLGLPAALGALALPPSLGVTAAAFAGAVLSTLLVYRLSTTGGVTSVTTMLLTGIAVNAGIFAVVGYAQFVGDDEQLRNVTMWTLGSLSGATSTAAPLALAIVVFAALGLRTVARDLDLLALGETEASYLGVHTQRVRLRVVALSALSVGAAVALSGPIGFVGLVVPHMARGLVGARHGAVLPLSALLGALLLVVSDTVARTVAAPAEVPIGILTAFVGVPFFLVLILRQRREGGA